MTKVTDDERLIEKSGYFREKWYLRNYPEAAGSGLAPARHYLQEGWKKGFRPSMQFDHEFYLNTYPEVNEAGICPLVHYEREGAPIVQEHLEAKPRRVCGQAEVLGGEAGAAGS